MYICCQIITINQFMNEISISSLEQLQDVARKVLESLEGRTVVLLDGAMGSGKTTLVKEIAAQLGSQDGVSSPTFAIVNEYILGDGESFFHFDMYRIESLVEARDMGFEEYVHSGSLCFIEWAERVEELLPDDCMVVRIDAPTPTDRVFRIE